MPPIRSAVLGKGRLQASGTMQLYAPPSGQVALVKTLYGFSRAAAPLTVDLVVRDQAGIDLPLLYESISPNVCFKWEGWVVLEYQTYIAITAPGGPIDVWLSGAILPDAYAP